MCGQPPGERHQELINGRLRLYERFPSSEGFLEGRVLHGSEGNAVLSYLRLRSAADQQRLDDNPEIRAGLEALQKIARPHREVYDVVWVSTPPSDQVPVYPLARSVLVAASPSAPSAPRPVQAIALANSWSSAGRSGAA